MDRDILAEKESQAERDALWRVSKGLEANSAYLTGHVKDVDEEWNAKSDALRRC